MGLGVLSQSNELDLLERARDSRTFWSAFSEVLRPLDIDFHIYLFRCADDRLFHHTDLPPDAYGGAERDPFLKYCCNNMGATFVGADYNARFPFLSGSERAFVEQAAKGGWGAGVAIPVCVRTNECFGGFNLGSRMDGARFEEVTRPRLDRLRSLCFFAQRKIEELGLLDTEDQAVSELALHTLTRREFQLARLLQMGLDRSRVAERLRISTQTVATHQKAIYRKLGIHSQMEIMKMPKLIYQYKTAA